MSTRLDRLAVLALGAALLGGMCGCGQRGDLFLPKDAAAAGRATLPESLRPGNTPAAPSQPVGTP